MHLVLYRSFLASINKLFFAWTIQNIQISVEFYLIGCFLAKNINENICVSSVIDVSMFNRIKDMTFKHEKVICRSLPLDQQIYFINDDFEIILYIFLGTIIQLNYTYPNHFF